MSRWSARRVAADGEVPPNKGADAAVLVLPCGDRALLVEVADLDAVAAVSAALCRSPVAGQR